MVANSIPSLPVKRTLLDSSETDQCDEPVCDSGDAFQVIKAMRFHLYSVWLFTFSYLKTIVVPSTVFALLHTFALRGFGDFGPGRSEPAWTIVARAPMVLFWAWSNLLPFAIDNQRQPDAILEDSHNKSWRTMPSKRLTQDQARRLMLATYPFAVAISFLFGGLAQCLTLIVLGIWYNDLGGADKSCIIRNLINAGGFMCYNSGALEVMTGIPVTRSWTLTIWLVIIGAIVFTTVHTQDMYDQAGDSEKGRKSVPLVIGDSLARRSIAIPVAFWSFLCPAFWNVGVLAGALPCVLGLWIGMRSLLKRGVEQDKTTFRLWNLWLTVLYTLPLIKSA